MLKKETEHTWVDIFVVAGYQVDMLPSPSPVSCHRFEFTDSFAIPMGEFFNGSAHAKDVFDGASIMGEK